MRRASWIAFFLSLAASGLGQITLTILHTDDLHAHVEPFKVKNGTYGGYARQAALIEQQRKKDPNVLVLSGGDTFQGTLYFNVYQGLADAVFLNRMGYQGSAIGNHEFDLGPDALGAYARSVTFPLLAANLDVSLEPALAGRISPSATIRIGRETVGLVGAVTPDLPKLSSPGPNVRMKDLIPSLSAAVADLERQRVNKIILLSHLGYELEKRVAAQVRGIDVIVGGHSHTLLGSFQNPDFPPSEGPYPTVVANPSGSPTLIVAAWEWGKVLGRLRVEFDREGRARKWEGAPIPVEDRLAEDPLAKSAVAALRMPVEAIGKTVIAQSPSGYDGSREKVRKEESPMANIVADAMLYATRSAGSQIAFINGGGVRASIDPGPITFEEAIQVQPFNNTLVVLTLTGAQVAAALEHGVSAWEQGEGRFLQVSNGFRYSFDPSKPVGGRISRIEFEGRLVDPAETYRVVVNSFMAGGGDGFDVFKAASARLDTGSLDVDALVAYLKQNPSLPSKPQGRIRTPQN